MRVESRLDRLERKMGAGNRRGVCQCLGSRPASGVFMGPLPDSDATGPRLVLPDGQPASEGDAKERCRACGRRRWPHTLIVTTIGGIDLDAL